MPDLLSPFAALTLITGVLLTLLPEGALRSTASMCAGLLLLLTWAEGLTSLLSGGLPSLEPPETVLTSSGTDLDAALRHALSALPTPEAAP